MIPKFRAWDVYNMEMFTNDQLIIWNGNIYANDPGKISADKMRGWSIDEKYLMQSTGLFSTFAQDELFEDDVISWTYFDEFEDSGKARIIHRDGCWKLLDIKTGKEAWDSLFDCLENCTVFLSGNIYENPDLVEEING